MKGWKTLVSLVLVLMMLLPATVSALGEVKQVDLWHLWTGREAETVDALVASFNAGQSEVQVTPLSVPDMQKITVAIASGTGPDVSDDFSTNIASYAAKGILMPLDDLIAEAGLSMDDFVPAALEACRYEGKLYALPLSINLMALYYNKDLFAAAGVEPPKTDVELLEAAKKLTKVNADGSIDVLGFPDFPNVYYLNNFMYAFGGRNIDADGKLTPDNDGTRRALDLISEYRREFGVENVVRFNTGGKYMDPTDPFLAGKQAMRVDGPWMGPTLDTLGINLNYGVIPLPYRQGHEDEAVSAVISCSVAYIPANASDPKASFEFLKYWCAGEGAWTFMRQLHSFPARYSLLNSEEFAQIKDFPAYGEMAKSPNLQVAPIYDSMTEYTKIISDEAELVMTLQKSIDDAFASMIEQAQDLN